MTSAAVVNRKHCWYRVFNTERRRMKFLCVRVSITRSQSVRDCSCRPTWLSSFYWLPRRDTWYAITSKWHWRNDTSAKKKKKKYGHWRLRESIIANRSKLLVDDFLCTICIRRVAAHWLLWWSEARQQSQCRAQINLHTNGSLVQAGCSITALTHAVITEQQAPGQALVWSTGLVLRPPPTHHVSPGWIRAQQCEPPHYQQPQWPPGSCPPHNNTPAA